MTMFSFSKTIFQPTHLKEPEMTLFIIYAKCTPIILAAYWAASIDDAFDAAVADGFDPGVIFPIQATPEQADQYHGPDFGGRKAFLVFDSTASMARHIHSLNVDVSGLLYGIAADDYAAAMDLDPAPFRERRVLIVGLRREADANLEPGWDQ